MINSVMETLQDVNKIMMEHRAEKWMSINLTISQLKSILFIYDRGQANYREIAGALGVTPSVVTGIVDRLTSHGILNRVSNPADRRTQWLQVTEEGKEILNSIRQENMKGLAQVLETMKEEDLSALVQGLTALFQAAQPFLEEKKKATRANITIRFTTRRKNEAQ